MISTLLALGRSVTGKVLLGVALVALTAGTAAAVGAPLPVVGDSGSDEHEVVEPEHSSEDEDTTVTSVAEPSDDEEGVEADSDGERPDNHGAVVSEFAHSTELEGCERGQAVAGVARGVLDPDSESFDDDLAVLLEGRCGNDDGVSGEDEGVGNGADVGDDASPSTHGPVTPSSAAAGGGAPGRSGSAPGHNK